MRVAGCLVLPKHPSLLPLFVKGEEERACRVGEPGSNTVSIIGGKHARCQERGDRERCEEHFDIEQVWKGRKAHNKPGSTHSAAACHPEVVDRICDQQIAHPPLHAAKTGALTNTVLFLTNAAMPTAILTLGSSFSGTFCD